MKCPYCKGKGWVYVYREIITRLYWGFSEEDCYLCEGSGKIELNFKTIKRYLKGRA